MCRCFERLRAVAGAAATVTALLCCSLPLTVRAQGMVPVDIFPNLVGIGVGVTPDYNGSDDNVFGFAPGVRYQFKDSHRFAEWWGIFGDINLINSPNWQFGPMLSFRFGREDVDDDVVDLLPDVDNTWEAGVFGSYTYLNTQGIPWRVRVGGGVLWDVGNVYDGYNAFGWASLWVPLSRQVFFGLGGGASYGDDKFMQTYYGVTPAGSAASGLPVYTAGSGMKNWYVWPALIWQFDKNWAAGVGAFYQRLINDATDSPVVSQRGTANQLTGGVGIGYLW